MTVAVVYRGVLRTPRTELGEYITRSCFGSRQPSAAHRVPGGKPSSTEGASNNSKTFGMDEELVFQGTAWRGVKVNSIFDLMREVNFAMKEEPERDERIPRPEPRMLDEEQRKFLSDLSKGCRNHDPSIHPQALADWRSFLEIVDVDRLRHTHNSISSRFRHGDHNGQTVSGLTHKLISGEVRCEDITPLVCLKWNGKLWVICGNRRLKALQDCANPYVTPGKPFLKPGDIRSQQARLGPIRVRCIVHRCPKKAPAEIIAKFLLAWDTTNHGVVAHVRGAPAQPAQQPAPPRDPLPMLPGAPPPVPPQRPSRRVHEASIPETPRPSKKQATERRRTGTAGPLDFEDCGVASGSRGAPAMSPPSIPQPRPPSRQANEGSDPEVPACSGQNPAAERFLQATPNPPDLEDRPRFTSIPAEGDEFYVRYYVGHKGKFGHAFSEFEFRPDGRLRYGNNSNYKNELMIRKEVHVTHAVIRELRKIVEDSEILKEDDSRWPAPDRVGRQELEIVCGKEHVCFTTSKIGCLADVRASKDPEGLRVFYHLVQDLKCFVSSIIGLHFRIRPV